MASGRALGDGRLLDLDSQMSRVRELSASVVGGLGHGWLYYTWLLAEAHETLEVFANFELPLPATSRSSRHDLRAAITASWLYTRTDRPHLARSMLAKVSRAELERMPVLHGDLGILTRLAEVYVALGDESGARSLYSRLTPHAEHNAVGPCLDYRGSVAHYLGLLAHTLGDEPGALAHLADARQRNGQLGMSLQLARTVALSERLASHQDSSRTGFTQRRRAKR